MKLKERFEIYRNIVKTAAGVDRCTATDRYLTKLPNNHPHKWEMKVMVANMKYERLSDMYIQFVIYGYPMWARRKVLSWMQDELNYIMRLNAYGLEMAPEMDFPPLKN